MTLLSQYKTQLTKKGIHISFIQNPDTIGYLTNFYSNPHERLMMLITINNEQDILIVPALDFEVAKSKAKNITIIPHFDSDNAFDVLAQTIKPYLMQTPVALDKDYMTILTLEKLQSHLPTVQFVYDCSAIITQLKLIKQPHEIELMLQAGKTADFAITLAAKALDTQKTETQLVAEVEFELKKHGVTTMSFDTMILTQQNAANPHGVPAQNYIQWNSFVLVDLGTVYNGYCSDITRTLFYGDCPTQHQKDIYNLVVKAHHYARDNFKLGMSASQLDQLARSVIEDAGYGKYFVHRLGHGIGTSVHEFPSIANGNDFILQEGMCFSIEPGIYIPNDIGVRIEDCFVVTKDGLQSLTNSSYDLNYLSYQ